MNRKQKKELREHQSTRQLMGISQITERGVKTAKGELVFFLVRPDNLSVLSPEGVQGRVSALADLLRATPSLRMLSLDFVDASSISLAPPQRVAAGLAHSAASPLPTKPKGGFVGAPILSRSRPTNSGISGTRRITEFGAFYGISIFISSTQ